MAIGWALAATGAPVRAETIPADVAKKFITDMGNRAISVLAMEGGVDARNQAFARLMVDAIDFDAVAMQTLGKMARTVGPKDRLEFTQLFAAHVIDVAIEKFGNTQVVKFTVGEPRPQPNGDFKIHTAIDRQGDAPLSVDWRVHGSSGQPKINDIEVESYSLVIHYRGEFERGNVSNVPGLIAKLNDMTKSSAALPSVRQAMR